MPFDSDDRFAIVFMAMFFGAVVAMVGAGIYGESKKAAAIAECTKSGKNPFECKAAIDP